MKTQAEMLLVGATRYDFKNDGGERVTGAKVTLIDGLTTLKGDNSYGFESITMNADHGIFDKLYKLSPLKSYIFSIDVNSKGKFKVLDVATLPAKQ